MIITIPSTEYEKLLENARQNLPNEACGLIAGEDTAEGVRAIRRVYCLRNVDASPEHFTLDPAEQLASIKDMRAEGLRPLGNWHSHPASPSRPSQEDIRLAFDSKASYLILSLQERENPVLNGFHIENGEVRKEELHIESA